MKFAYAYLWWFKSLHAFKKRANIWEVDVKIKLETSQNFYERDKYVKWEMDTSHDQNKLSDFVGSRHKKLKKYRVVKISTSYRS